MATEILAAELDIEIRKYRRNMDEALRKAKGLDVALEGVDKAGRKADKSLNALKGGVNVDIKADTSAIDRASADVKSLDGASPTITPEVDDSKFKSFLDMVKNGAVLGVSVIATGAGAAIAEDVRSDRAAVGAFALGTGKTREEAAVIGDTINEVWNTGLAESKTQIAGVAASLYQAGVGIEEIGAAATDAFTIAAATGEDVNEIIRAQTTLVRTGLASSYSEASDLIAGGFAGGLNRADDFLDTINEYSQDFADLRLTAGDFFTILDTGLEGGAYNTDKIADAFRELKIRVDTALSSGTGSEYEGLRTLGLLDEAAAFRAGEITGQQWVDAVLSVTSAANLDAVVTGAFGSPIEDLGVSVFDAIDAALGNPELQTTWQGTTETMRDTLSDNLDTAFKRAYNVVVNDLAEAVEVAGQPLSKIFDELPQRLNEFSDAIAGGAGIPEALEIALDAPGLSEDIRQLQANLGGFIVELQLAIAGFLEGIGQGGAAVGLRESAAAGARGQLAFDLQYLDPDQATEAIATAIRRGVDQAGLDAAIAEAGANLIGDDQLKRFELILAQLGDQVFLDVTTRVGAFSQQGLWAYQTDMSPDEIQAQLSAQNANIANLEFGETYTFDTEALLEDAGVVETLGIRTAEADDALIDYGNTIDNSVSKFDTFGNTFVTRSSDAANAVEDFGSRAIAVLAMVDQAAAITQQNLFDAGIDPAAFAAHVFGATIDAANVDGSHAAGLDYVPYDGYIAELHKGEAVLTAQQAMQYFNSPMMGGSTSINTVNINVSQNLNAGGMAQASAAGSRFASQIRGFS